MGGADRVEHQVPEASAGAHLRSTSATLLRSYFSTRREALDEIANDGWWPVSWVDPPNSSYPAHYHVAAESLYLLDGEMEFTDVRAGIAHTLKPFDKLVIPERVVHSVTSTPGATYLISLKVLGPFDDHFVAADRPG